MLGKDSIRHCLLMGRLVQGSHGRLLVMVQTEVNYPVFLVNTGGRGLDFSQPLYFVHTKENANEVSAKHSGVGVVSKASKKK